MNVFDPAHFVEMEFNVSFTKFFIFFNIFSKLILDISGTFYSFFLLYFFSFFLKYTVFVSTQKLRSIGTRKKRKRKKCQRTSSHFLTAFKKVHKVFACSIWSIENEKTVVIRQEEGFRNRMSKKNDALFDMVDHPDAQEEMMNFNIVKNGNEASALRNELLALMVLICLLVLGVIIYFVFRSMVYIKKEKAQERLPINTFGPINLP
ncbi:hypothetical protein CAEBREN_06426 [Caenorhabditis brenneri]|uniref:Uncharacterized protein n=1 Tax=Caenorhabditis brenneri TaxID=135651 RepID=G0M8F3_CAEBE|nr:hypothetical protein CAEBREN_06426 [Caenorhabditis brenneri]